MNRTIDNQFVSLDDQVFFSKSITTRIIYKKGLNQNQIERSYVILERRRFLFDVY
jgi:hypothetical protein